MMETNVTAKSQPGTKVVLTQKIRDSEQQTIVTQRKNSPLSLARGEFISHTCEGIFSLHGGASYELENSQVVCTSEASTIITLLIEGNLQFGYDDLEFTLDASAEPQALIVNLAQPCNFHRRLVKGSHIVKLNLVISPQWIANRIKEACPASQFVSTHKAAAMVNFTSEMLEATKKVLSLSAPKTLNDHIQLEASSFALIQMCIEQLADKPTAESPACCSTYNDSIGKAIHYIEQHLSEDIRLEKLAQHMAMSVSSLQSKFKQQLGMTVASYTRDRRLHIARKHLEKGYCSITEAAYEAGYHHPSNFSAAFKKAFGESPQAFMQNKTE